ncbi:MAG: alpha/beta hydrolase, partial [Solirubrobacterales bacterium]
MISTIEVLNGPNPGVDDGTLRRWCEAWGKDLGVPMRVQDLASPGQVVAAVAASGDDVGVLLNPGDADLGELTAVAAAAGDRLGWIETGEAESPRPSYFEDASVIAVRGRGIHGYRWGARWLLQRAESPCSVIAYGLERDQVGDLRVPSDADGPVPVAVLIHGGFWRERWERDTIEPLAIDLAARGYATWNLEYRRTAHFGGGWPGTFADIAAGIDHLSELAGEHPLDLDRVVLVGHSAGGHLALWAVTRRGVDGTADVRAAYVVSLAGIGDLAECARRGLGDTGNAAASLMGASPD